MWIFGYKWVKIISLSCLDRTPGTLLKFILNIILPMKKTFLLKGVKQQILSFFGAGVFFWGGEDAFTAMDSLRKNYVDAQSCDESCEVHSPFEAFRGPPKHSWQPDHPQSCPFSTSEAPHIVGNNTSPPSLRQKVDLSSCLDGDGDVPSWVSGPVIHWVVDLNFIQRIGGWLRSSCYPTHRNRVMKIM